jgi:hypothetical protein
VIGLIGLVAALLLPRDKARVEPSPLT